MNQAGSQQETDDKLKMDNMRESNKGTIYKGVGRGVDPPGAGNTRPAGDKERTGCGLPDKSCDLLLRGTGSPQ